MKKSIKLIILIMIIIAIICTNFTFSYAVTGKPGETVNVTFTIKSPDSGNLDTVTGNLEYDNNILKYDSISSSAGIASNEKISATRSQINGSSMTVTATFKIKEGIGNTSTTVKLKLSELYTTVSEANQATSISTTISVKTPETTPETPSEPQTPSEPETPKELQFTKVNETVYVKKTVNLRSNYSSSSKLIATIDVGEALTRIGKSVATAEGYSWSKILYNGQEVYAISRNLTTEKPETTEETTEETPNEEQPTEETPTEETPVEENPTEEETSKVFGLSKLEIKNSTLSPKFDLETYEYTIGIKEDISSLEIEAVANNENATVEIIGNENLQDGENVITILVTNAETGEVATYQIIVNKNTQKEGVAKVNWLQPSTWGTREKIIVGIIGALILLIVILIIVKIRLAKREDDDLDLPGADELDRALTEHQELTENEEIETIKQEEKSNADIEKPQEYFEKYSKRKGKHF